MPHADSLLNGLYDIPGNIESFMSGCLHNFDKFFVRGLNFSKDKSGIFRSETDAIAKCGGDRLHS